MPASAVKNNRGLNFLNIP